MKVTIETLSQTLRHFFYFLWIVGNELWGRFSTGRRLVVYLGGQCDFRHVHSDVLAVECAAEGAGAGVGRGGTHNAQIS